jgi:hypothetical protein
MTVLTLAQELGLEGFDKVVDKYHDKAYDTARDSSGRVWKKVHIPGKRKAVYEEQNPRKGKEAQQYDPAKDQVPSGFKVDHSESSDGRRTPSPDGRQRRSQPDRGQPDRPRRDTITQNDYGHDHRGGYEPPTVDERDYYHPGNLDSPRKVRINPFKEIRTSIVTSLS